MANAERIMEYEILQGSILGPTLFNIYSNGLFSINCHVEVFIFADDTTISFEAENGVAKTANNRMLFDNLKVVI